MSIRHPIYSTTNIGRQDQHFFQHEAKRKAYGLPSLEEQRCEACEKGLKMIEEGKSQL